MNVGMRWLIRDEVISIIEEENVFAKIDHLNVLDDVVDKSIIESNGIMMFGSKNIKVIIII